jgi:hypothetical protein
VDEWKDSVTGDSFFPLDTEEATPGVDEEQQLSSTTQDKYAYKESSMFHKTRRKAILAKYPEVESLFGPSCIPLLYGFLCFWGVIYVGYYFGQNQGSGASSWYYPLLMAWTVLPILSFGLNNVNNEICHGNTWFLGLSSPCDADDSKHHHSWCKEVATKVVLMLNGLVALNHFQFYYYSSSHKSHHGALGNQTDRGHAFRSLYFTFFQTKEGTVQCYFLLYMVCRIMCVTLELNRTQLNYTILN